MPQTGQSGSIKAPESRAALDALIEQRNELQGQLRALEDRRFLLADQHAHLEGSLAVDVERRVKSLDGSIDRLEGQIARANELITAGQARFGSQSQPAIADFGPGPPAPSTFPGVAEFPPFPQTSATTDIGRALLLEGAGFVLLGAVAWVWAIRRLERKLTGRTSADPSHMTHLQQSVDAIALEVERISENQRWVTKVMNEKALGAGDARPVDVGVPAAERVKR